MKKSDSKEQKICALLFNERLRVSANFQELKRKRIFGAGHLQFVSAMTNRFGLVVREGLCVCKCGGAVGRLRF
ncbi:hypothetical protein ASD71_08620 [Achromobacter sp. Root565]|nr:hypothetical protein ASD71_08620 [Achromobacter sp. Root565]